MVEATRTVAAASGRRRVRPRGAIGEAGHDGLDGGGDMAGIWRGITATANAKQRRGRGRGKKSESTPRL
jgi:hypothetical protein